MCLMYGAILSSQCSPSTVLNDLSFLILFLVLYFLWCIQRCQSGLKSGGRGSGSKTFNFSNQISEKFRFFHLISQKKFDFPGKIGHLQLLLGKVFYFSSKVNTFEHISVHDKIQ